MPKITPTQITLPVVRFAEASGKSECQVRKDPAEAKYKSVAGGSCHMIPIDSEIAAGIVELAVHMPRKIALNQCYKSSPYTRHWSRSSRDHRGYAPRARRSRLMMSLIH